MNVEDPWNNAQKIEHEPQLGKPFEFKPYQGILVDWPKDQKIIENVPPELGK